MYDLLAGREPDAGNRLLSDFLLIGQKLQILGFV
jgi:hypothetical protein